MKKILLLTVALATTLMAQADNELLYGIYRGSGTLKGIGTEKAETYDVAIHLTEPYLVGMEILGINVPVNTAAKNTADYKAWLSTDLILDGGQNAPDIASVSFTPDGKWAQVDFETPYVITEAGVYAGYSFTVSEVDLSNTSDQNRTPLQAIASSDNTSAFIHTSRTFRKWKPFPETTLSSSAPALVVRLGGERIKENAATFVTPSEDDAFTLVGKSLTLTLTLVNHGTAAIKSIDYDLEIGDEETINKHLTTSVNGKYYGYQKDYKVTIPAMQTSGTRTVTFRITKVNDLDNEDDVPAVSMDIAFLAELPKHKPLMEEYTGTWCGYCPRGMVAMEALTEQLGDDFVGVAFHNGDIMTVTNNYPNDVSGFPASYLDRVSKQDPFYGSNSSSLGIKKDWEKRAAVIAPANLELQMEWEDEACTAIRVTSYTTFVRRLADNPYRLAYILVADSLHGEGRSWSQSNYFSGDNSYAGDPYLSKFVKMGGQATGLYYNDVVIQLSCSGASALAESLPAAIEENIPYAHEYVFNIADNELVQDKTKLRAVAILINTLTGEVANAEKARLAAADGIQAPDSQPSTLNSQPFDLSGRRVERPGRGIYVRTSPSGYRKFVKP